METITSRKKVFIQNTFMVLVSLVIALLIGEVILHLARPEPAGRVVSDPVLEFRAEGFPDFDMDGWHNAAIPAQANIVALGDSMTQGQGVDSREDAWPQALGRIASTSVYQMALGGYGPVQYAHLLEKAKTLEPKIVIVGFYFGNDLYDAQHIVYNFDAWKSLRSLDFRGATNTKVDVADITTRNAVLAGATKGSFMYRVFTVRLWIREHSRLYALLGDATRTLRENLGLARTESEKNAKTMELAAEDPNAAYVYNKDPRITTVLSPSYRFDAINLANVNTEEGWRITQERFKAMKELLGTSARLVIVEIPTKEAVYLDLMQKEEGKIPEQFEQYRIKENELEKTFMTFCAATEINCFSLRKTMLAKLEAREPVYKRIMDGHLPAEGYYAVAEGIYAYLKAEGLLEGGVSAGVSKSK